MSQKRGAYAPEFPQKVVQLVRVSRKPGELANEFGCHKRSISAWIRQAYADERGGSNRIDWMLWGLYDRYPGRL